VTCKHCGVEIMPCPNCSTLGVLGAGYLEASDDPSGDGLGTHWCARIADGTGHEPEVTT
jgi:hypothetical protein